MGQKEFRMQAIVSWSSITDYSDPKWNFTRCLYAYVHPRTGEICYIGKSDGLYSSVRARFDGRDKDRAFAVIQAQRRVSKYDLGVIVGIIRHTGTDSNRLTTELLDDMESLLIWYISPVGNERNIFSRPCCRPGMTVKCSGEWPHPTSTFQDIGPTYKHIGELFRDLSN